MDSVNNPSYLDIQHPKVIDTKKFGYAALSQAMAAAGTDSDDDVGLRCRALTLIYAGGNSSKFAADIGITATRWNNIERSGALSRDVTRRIIRQHDEVSLDWLLRGKDDAFSRTRAEEFLAAFRTVAAQAKPAPAPTKRKKRVA